MDTILNFVRPYLCRKNLSERAIIDKRIQDELTRIRQLLPPQQATFQANPSLKNIKAVMPAGGKTVVTKSADISQTHDLDIKPPGTAIPITEGKTTLSNQARSITNTTPVAAPVILKAPSDTLTNDPNGTITPGYNCVVDFVTTLDYKFGKGDYEVLVWYVVFEHIDGNYYYESEGYDLSGVLTYKKPFFESKTIGKWSVSFDMYAYCKYPATKFKVIVEKYKDYNTTPHEVIHSDIVTINFDSTKHCIYIHDMGLIASNKNGGYPSIKGGDHGDEPTLYINLNSPAPPDGQKVSLDVTSVSSSNKEAWINPGMGEVTIAGGQNHGEWSGVVGSRHVLTTKDVHVKATVNKVPGVATLRITKK